MVVMETIKYTCIPTPCVQPLVSLGSEEVVLKKMPGAIFCSCHGNISVPSFTLYWATLRSEEVIEENCLRLILVGGCHGNDYVYQVMYYTEQV